MLKNLFVSCVYDLYHVPVGPDADLNRLSLETRLKHMEQLFRCDIPLILYAEPELMSILPDPPANITIVPLPLSEVKTYCHIMNQQLQLPEERNKKKDIQEYFSLVNSKLDFIELARTTYPAVNYTWIDCAIFKLFDPRETAANMLSTWASDETADQIASPSGWPNQFPYLLANTPNWKFLGSIIKIPDKLFDVFHQACQNALNEHMTTGNVTWEVSYWGLVESQHPEWFYMYIGTGTDVGHHDINMLRRPDLGLLG